MRDDISKEEEQYIKKSMIEFVAQFRSDIAGRLMVKMAADGMEVLSGDDALELVESLDEHSIGEIMVCAATDALFLK